MGHLPLIAALAFAGVLLTGAAAVIVRSSNANALIPPLTAPVKAAPVLPVQAAATPPPPAPPVEAPPPAPVVEAAPLEPQAPEAVTGTGAASAPGTLAKAARARPEAEVAVAPPRPMKSSTPTLEDLLQSIDRLERRVDRLETSGKLDAPKANAARNLLAKYRDAARADTSAPARLDLQKKVTGVAGMIR